MTKTFLPEHGKIQREWILVDADGQVLGRLASQLSEILRGRHKPIFTPHMDTGDFVVVINAEKIKLTGKKEEQKIYDRYTGYRSGLKHTSAAAMRARHPERMIKLAVKGMLPNNALCRKAIGKLNVYAGDKHPHAAQNPRKYELHPRKGAKRG
ncbi:MAG: 50S ribosomal protein L13 [bacterium]